MTTASVSVPDPIDLLGVTVHPIDQDELLRILRQWAGGPAQRCVFYANVHGVNLAQTNREFRIALNSADLVFCDGYGLKVGASLLGRPLPGRMTPPDWIDEFADLLALDSKTVFALGDEDGVAKLFADQLAQKHPGLRVVGTANGFFKKIGPENDEVIHRLNTSGADVLLIGFGMPLQERWVADNASRLDARVIVTVGALFRWYAGVEKRAPRWITNSGLEWLARLARHPRRHFQRYVIGNPMFVLRILADRLGIARRSHRISEHG